MQAQREAESKQADTPQAQVTAAPIKTQAQPAQQLTGLAGIRARTEQEVQLAKQARDQAIARAQQAERRAASEQSRADAAQAEAARQEATGKGPKYRAAKAKAEAAAKNATEAQKRADQARNVAEKARQDVTAAIKRGNTELGKEKERIATKARQDQEAKRAAYLGGLGFAVAATGGTAIADKVAGSSAERKNKQLIKLAKETRPKLKKATGKARGAANAMRAVQANVNAARQLGLTSTGLLSRARGKSGLLGGAVALGASSLVFRATAADIRSKGDEETAKLIETFALGEQVAAGAIALKTLPSLIANPKLDGAALATMREAQAVTGSAQSAIVQAGANAAQTAKGERLAQSARGLAATGSSVAELRAQAAQLGIKNASRMRKTEIQAAITTAQKSGNSTLLGGFIRGAGKVVGTVARFLAPVGLAGTAIAASSTSAKGKSLTQQVLEGPDLKSDVAYQAADFLSFGAVSATKATVEKLASPSVGAKPLVGGGRPGAGNARLDRQRQEFLAQQAAANDQLAAFKDNAAAEVQQSQPAQSPEPWAPSSNRDQRQYDGMASVADRSQMAALHDTPDSTDHAMQRPYMRLASQYAKDVAMRKPPVTTPSPNEVAQKTVQPSSGGKALRGFANPAVQAAAQAARRRKARGGF